MDLLKFFLLREGGDFLLLLELLGENQEVNE